MNPILIAIAGGSASGKSTISRKLKEKYENENSVTIIRQDDYYKDQSHLTMEQRVQTNYDHPFAFDNDLLIIISFNDCDSFNDITSFIFCALVISSTLPSQSINLSTIYGLIITPSLATALAINALCNGVILVLPCPIAV